MRLAIDVWTPRREKASLDSRRLACESEQPAIMAMEHRTAWIAGVLGNQEIRWHIGRCLTVGSRGEAQLIGVVRWVWKSDGRFRLKVISRLNQYEYEERQQLADAYRARLAELQWVWQNRTSEQLPRYWMETEDREHVESVWGRPWAIGHPISPQGRHMG